MSGAPHRGARVVTDHRLPFRLRCGRHRSAAVILLLQLQVGWKLLWMERVRRDLDPIYRVVACRRGRHRDAHMLADDLVGSPLADDYPELAVCEICGRAVEWPNGRPSIEAR
jgi:hypothetical protein